MIDGKNIMKTDLIFSFDTEDFTSNVAADAIYHEAEILRNTGIRGCFCVVGLLAQQLRAWGRNDVIDALSHHEIATHSWGHSYSKARTTSGTGCHSANTRSFFCRNMDAQ